MKLSTVRSTRWIRSAEHSGGIDPTTILEDQAYREAVLRLLLRDAPLATIEELVTSYLVGLTPDELEETRDGIERAVLDLATLGVLNVEGRVVYASGVARETGRLLDDPCGPGSDPSSRSG